MENLDALESNPAFQEIRAYLEQQEVFASIGTRDLHVIVVDILSRYVVTRTMWRSWGEFSENYTRWVSSVMYGNQDDSTMWETWANLLRSLYLPLVPTSQQ